MDVQIVFFAMINYFSLLLPNELKMKKATGRVEYDSETIKNLILSMIRKGKSKLTILTHIKSKTKKENSELQELYNLAIYSISDMFSDSNELIKIETKARYEYIIEKCLKQDLPSGFEVARKNYSGSFENLT